VQGPLERRRLWGLQVLQQAQALDLVVCGGVVVVVVVVVDRKAQDR